MWEKDLNELIVEAIKEKCPQGMKPCNYLMDILFLGKESAYRRISNQIPFTFKEIAVLAQKLNFSIDSILKQVKENSGRVEFQMPVDLSQNSTEKFTRMLSQCQSIAKLLCQAENLKISLAINCFPWHYLPYETLFKFKFCQYLDSERQISPLTHYSDIVIPPGIMDLYRQVSTATSQLSNITCLIDKALFFKLNQELLYYKKRGFFEEKDLILIKQELIQVLGDLSKLTTTGKNGNGSQYSVYYSEIPIDCNCIYYEWDESKMSQIWIYTEAPLVFTNNDLINNMQKNHIESKIKYATLLTKSNDLLQNELWKEFSSLITNLEN